MKTVSSPLSRRDFVKTTAAAVGGTLLAGTENFAYAAGSDVVRVGLIGCGGRGTGAARDCVQAHPSVRITALGDLFQDRLGASRPLLKEAVGDKLTATDATSFAGMDAYRHVLESDVDAVILATPPGWRPLHLRAAVEAGKHVFMEKPVAVDPVGVRSVIESGEIARAKNLSIVAGTQYRRQPSFVEAVRRIHDGAIGDLVSAQEYYLTGTLWLRERTPEMSDAEWQMRNWYYFTWLSGDHIVEQFVHNIDTIDWVFNARPVKALGMGGREVRVDPNYGHIYDHFSVEYEYPNGARVEAKCRQMDGVAKRVTNRIVGTKGVAEIHPDRSVITTYDGQVLFRTSEKGNNPYVQEHVDLIASIRDGRPINEARQVAESTLTAVMGRESAYTGQEITWEEISASDQSLMPESIAFGPLPTPPVPKPGVTKLSRTAFAHAG